MFLYFFVFCYFVLLKLLFSLCFVSNSQNQNLLWGKNEESPFFLFFFLFLLLFYFFIIFFFFTVKEYFKKSRKSSSQPSCAMQFPLLTPARPCSLPLPPSSPPRPHPPSLPSHNLSVALKKPSRDSLPVPALHLRSAMMSWQVFLSDSRHLAHSPIWHYGPSK